MTKPKSSMTSVLPYAISPSINPLSLMLWAQFNNFLVRNYTFMLV